MHQPPATCACAHAQHPHTHTLPLTPSGGREQSLEGTGALPGFTGSALQVLHGHTRCVSALLADPVTGHLLSCSLDGSLRVWDYVAGTALHK